MTLESLKNGKHGHILAIEGGRNVQARLASMGIFPGTEVKVVHNSGRGPAVISVEGKNIVLGRGVMNKILIA